MKRDLLGLYGVGLPGCLPKRSQQLGLTMDEILIILLGMDEMDKTRK